MPIVRWSTKSYYLALLKSHIITYPTPININYMWSFGFLAAMCLVWQILTGIFLAMHYVSDIPIAFYCVEHIMRDVNGGWFMRYGHANGASMFFIVVYIHIFRGLYYTSYIKPRQALWISGIVIFLLMMATAFLGYVLPWGQMSFWGATVITNLFSSIPMVGEEIVEWLWGGFSVGSPTLNRFFSIHYTLPFLILGMVLVHLSLLHENGSTNPSGVPKGVDYIPFYPYFVVKDVFSLTVFAFFFGFIIFYYPNILGHPDNYIMGSSQSTPEHIVPEWYFLPFYAILRSVPSKLGGVLLMFGAIVVLFILPFIHRDIYQNVENRPHLFTAFWCLFFNFAILGWIGQKEVETPFSEIGSISTILYFGYFVVFLPNSIYVIKLIPIIGPFLWRRAQKLLFGGLFAIAMSQFPEAGSDPLTGAVVGIACYLVTSGISLGLRWLFKSDQDNPDSGNTFNSSAHGAEGTSLFTKVQKTDRDMVAILTKKSRKIDETDPGLFATCPPLRTGHGPVDSVVEILGGNFGFNSLTPGSIRVIEFAKILLKCGRIVPEEYAQLFIFLTFGRKALYDYLEAWKYTSAGKKMHSSDYLTTHERILSKPKGEPGFKVGGFDIE